MSLRFHRFALILVASLMSFGLAGSAIADTKEPRKWKTITYKVKPGDTLLTAAFGAGLTWGAGLIRWGKRVTPLSECKEDLPPSDKTALELLQPWIEGCQQAVAARG